MRVTKHRGTLFSCSLNYERMIILEHADCSLGIPDNEELLTYNSCILHKPLPPNFDPSDVDAINICSNKEGAMIARTPEVVGHEEDADCIVFFFKEHLTQTDVRAIRSEPKEWPPHIPKIKKKRRAR